MVLPPRMYVCFINKEENDMENQTEIKLPAGVVERTSSKIDQLNKPDKMRTFSYKGFFFSVGCSINGWYEMKLEIPMGIFDELFYDRDGDCPNHEFMNIVNWKYSHKHGCFPYDSKLFGSIDGSSDDCRVYREIWLEYNGLEDKPMTWDEYVTQFNEFVFNISWEEVIVTIKQELKNREIAFTRYLNEDYENGLQHITFNVWNTESLINEAVRIIDDILKYANIKGKEYKLTVDEEGPITSFKGEYAFLSNFYPCPVGLGWNTFQNAEAAFQSCKSADLADTTQFVNMTGQQAKRVGRKVELRPDWEYIKDNVMECVVSCKFNQNGDLRDKLLATGNRELIEGNTWNDTYWGVCNGKGQNKLGKILMKVRDDCKRRY